MPAVLVTGDILDLPRLIQTIRHYGVERIIHLAAVLPAQAEANPLLGCRVNAEGSMKQPGIEPSVRS